MLFPVMIKAFSGNNNFYMVFMVDAQSKDEATGKAMRINYRMYPNGDGFSGHYVIVGDISDVQNPDGKLVKDGVVMP